MIRAWTITCAALTLAACTTPYDSSRETLATASLSKSDRTSAGVATLYADGDSLAINATFRNLKPGVHAFHLHTTGRCDAPEFTSAGGHLNPSGNEHGTLNPAGAHLGDLPNVTIASDGTGSAIVELEGEAAANRDAIFDADGTAVMLHAGPDDYASDPAGAAGPRVACGVLERLG